MEPSSLVTKKVYLDDTYKFEHTAKILKIEADPKVPTEVKLGINFSIG